MLKLRYTKDNLTNETLRSSVATMIMLWAKHDGECLCFGLEYDISPIIDYVVSYNCMIQMSQSDREWEVYEWISGREVNVLDEKWDPTWDVSVLSFEEWKPMHYDTPLLHEWYYYVPSDMMNRDDAKVMLNNWCKIVNISDYLEMLPKENILSNEM